MSKYTRENPFEFEGVKCHAWWTEMAEIAKVTVETPTTAYPMNKVTAEAIHAFIESESEGWRYTNVDKTEARNGRWRMAQSDLDCGHRDPTEPWGLCHDDFGDTTWWSDSNRGNLDTQEMFESFEAWHAAQSQQSLPDDRGERLAALVDEVKRSKCAVEIEGVRIKVLP